MRVIGCFLLSILLCLPAFAWDGNWTNARTTMEVIPDADDSTSEAGTKERPQKFMIPPERFFNNVDPEETSEYKGKDYAPYALARFPVEVPVQGRALQRGYYLVKLGHLDDGSEAVRLTTSSINPPTDGPAPYRTFLLKQLGNVMGILPIQQIERYQKVKGEKPPKKPIAWVESERHRSVLKFYYDGYVYSTTLGTM